MKIKFLLSTLVIMLGITATAQNQVTLYSNCEFGGNSQNFKAGRYNLSQSKLGAKTLSSIRIPNGMKVILYTGSTPGTGTHQSYINDVDCLNNSIWNDKAVSIVVENINTDNKNKNSISGNKNSPQ